MDRCKPQNSKEKNLTKKFAELDKPGALSQTIQHQNRDLSVGKRFYLTLSWLSGVHSYLCPTFSYETFTE
jgi:hypothetical protein